MARRHPLSYRRVDCTKVIASSRPRVPEDCPDVRPVRRRARPHALVDDVPRRRLCTRTRADRRTLRRSHPESCRAPLDAAEAEGVLVQSPGRPQDRNPRAPSAMLAQHPPTAWTSSMKASPSPVHEPTVSSGSPRPTTARTAGQSPSPPTAPSRPPSVHPQLARRPTRCTHANPSPGGDSVPETATPPLDSLGLRPSLTTRLCRGCGSAWLPRAERDSNPSLLVRRRMLYAFGRVRREGRGRSARARRDSNPQPSDP